MATTADTTLHHHTSRVPPMHYTTTTDDEEFDVNDSDMDEQNDNDDNNKREDVNTNVVVCGGGSRRSREGWSLGRFLVDPKWVEEWNRVFLLVCATGLFVDPLFFYALSISDTCMCFFVDGWFAITVTVLRCMTDTLHLWNMWLQFKMAKRSLSVVGHSDNVHSVSATTRGSVALRYVKAKRGFFFDLFVLLPLPQVRL